MTHDVDVVIVGGGPVGTTALALCGRAGLRAIAFEKDAELWPTARAVHFDGETMRTLQGLGVAERFQQVTIPMRDVAILNEAGEVLVHAPTDRIGEQGWNDHISFHQPDIEELLREVVAETPGIELRCGETVTDVESTDDGVVVTSSDAAGEVRTTRARWAIVADGARSEIRHRLGIESDKYGEDTPWLVVDGQLVDAPGYEPDMIQFGRHTRPALWLRLPGDRVRMEFMLMPDDDPAEIVTPAAVERISRGALPADKFTPDRQAIYTFRGRIAREWRRGNVFLAGDAAHQAPPLFGQGLCAGIRDAANLVWKLDLVARGVADESLLDTYESERKPHATFWVETAANQAVIIQTTDPQVAHGRDEYIRANPGASAVPEPPVLGPGLHAGEGGGGGKLGPQPILADGIRLDDMVGSHFLVAAEREVHDDLSPALRAALDDDGEVITLLDPAKVSDLLTTIGARAAVLRPDHYILGTAGTAPELERLLLRVPSLAGTANLTA
ncbi:bifunctional 3-(3-hydroxy-phenyl)propionate/3-hydroxycinnamic acid hydroxylase [Microbacterium trichothecenolyticum]|uniref:bifunctional 3-(3-hydroxy-phenyl)propionate/3-hydroxycinnamic acid hydroxylase n=1 Tax=Microbacterium trichothecenolyticum TaxID=69370 RepID=UPI001C6EDFD3|nr:bifunctional 3-(3-hydroxy-phenyl)propionate/3-hydroxycinnamic acid hydroxylase [Microbacterium trichothecenolyticum]MBW9120483.1 bifunctional 3-(3-hydroxy-phenyl)propionate/3-hydroxycinnamic acid hydroxylase [Microbacterium trichothecenolyticum]